MIRPLRAKQDEAALVSVMHAQAAFAEGMATALKVDKVTSDIRQTTTELDRMRAALQNMPSRRYDTPARNWRAASPRPRTD